MDGDEDKDSETQVLESHSVSLLRRAEQREWRYLFLTDGMGTRGSDKASFFCFFQESTLRGQMKKMGSKTTEKLNCKDFTLRCTNCVSSRIIFLLYCFAKNTRDNADTEHL